MESGKVNCPELQLAVEGKRKYQRPVLQVFGMVADLTKETGCTGSNDNSATCGASGNNMAKVSSDQSLKENIVRIGNHPRGIGLYLFDYKPEFRDQWGHGRQFGVMAQEVETVMPEAVCTHPDGYKMVDYAMLGVTRVVH